MHWIFGQFLEAIPSILCILLTCFVLQFVFIHSWRRTFGLMIMGSYLICVLTVVGFPNVLYHPFEVNFNILPFGEMRGSSVDTVLNIILFIPLGFLLPLLWANYRRFCNTLAFSFLTSLTIELSQLFTFRATDIDDVITNTLGGCIGFGIAFILLQHREIQEQSNTAKWDLYAIVVICFVIMFFIHPFLSQTIYTLIS